MNLRDIKAERTRLGLTQKYMADRLGISEASYRKKEAGTVKWSDEEKVLLVEILHLTYEQYNNFFYKGKLPKSYPNLTLV